MYKALKLYVVALSNKNFFYIISTFSMLNLLEEMIWTPKTLVTEICVPCIHICVIL